MQNQQATPRTIFLDILDNNRPQAMAWVTGDFGSPLSGLVKFYETPYLGVLVEAEVFNLPTPPAYSSFFGMHIHEKGDCSNHFMNTGNHYNPGEMPHPQHAGDLIPLLGNDGYAWMSFYTKRFTIKDILGRSVIIHSLPDDFTSQPSGNSGSKIGCGVIQKTN